MELDQVAAMYVLGLLPSDELPAHAADALEAGLDSPSLRQLAGATDTDSARLSRLFRKALDELGIPSPSLEDAGRSTALRIAEEIVRGVVGPYEGAKRIWTQIQLRFPQFTELRPFVGLASEHEDDESHRDEYARLIVQEAANFLGAGGGSSPGTPSPDEPPAGMETVPRRPPSAGVTDDSTHPLLVR